MQYVEVIFGREGETDYNYTYVPDDEDTDYIISLLVPDGWELIESSVSECEGPR